MTKVVVRDEFARAMQRFTEAKPVDYVAFQRAYELELERAWRGMFGARKFPHDATKCSTAMGQAYDTITQEWRGKVRAVTDRLEEVRDEANATMDSLAPYVTIRHVRDLDQATNGQEYYRSSIWTYSTQTAPSTYAEGDAKIRLAEALKKEPGLNGWIRRDCTVVDEDRHGAAPAIKAGKLNGFLVMLAVESKLDVEVLRHRPEGLSMKEWLMLSWRHNCNPRVFNPFVPYGLEEKLGLDYFGNEVKRC